MGGGRLVGRRALLAEVDLDDLHDAPAARLRPAGRQPAGAQGLHAPPRRRAAARRRHQLRLAGPERDLHHRHGAVHPRRYFEYDDDRLDTVADHLLEQQMPDGGWNCRRDAGATHASVHTTISALEGLRLYEQPRAQRAGGARRAAGAAASSCWRTGCFAPTAPARSSSRIFTRFSFPPRWHYDILRALDYFQAVGAPRDERLDGGDRDRLRARRRCRRPLAAAEPLQRARPTSSWNGSAPRAAGTRCARYAY